MTCLLSQRNHSPQKWRVWYVYIRVIVPSMRHQETWWSAHFSLIVYYLPSNLILVLPFKHAALCGRQGGEVGGVAVSSPVVEVADSFFWGDRLFLSSLFAQNLERVKRRQLFWLTAPPPPHSWPPLFKHTPIPPWSPTILVSPPLPSDLPPPIERPLRPWLWPAPRPPPHGIHLLIFEEGVIIVYCMLMLFSSLFWTGLVAVFERHKPPFL